MEREENMVIDINMKDDIYPEDCVVNKENDEEIRQMLQSNELINVNKKEKEIEVSQHPDNLVMLSQKENDYLNISKEYVQYVVNEYNETHKKLNELKNNHEIIQHEEQFKIVNESKQTLMKPTDELIQKRIFPYLSNKYCIQQIRSINNLLFLNKKKKNIDNSILYEWLYCFLLLLNPPLTANYNSVLYETNKNIFSQKVQLHQSTLIYIIISNIFKQKVINY